MRLKGFWLLGALALAGMALATAGCGGGGSTTTVTVGADTTQTATDELTTTETTITESTDTDTTATDTTAMTTTDETATETTSTDGTSTNALGFLTSAKCQEYVQLIGSYSQALSGAAGSDPQQAAKALQDVADQAPDEIKGDFQTLADAYGKIADALGDANLGSGQVPSADTIAALQALSKDIDTAKLAAASSNISTWLTQNCSPGGSG